MVAAPTPVSSRAALVTLFQPEKRAALASVLIVDDDEDTRLVVRALLLRTGRFLIVGEAADARQAIELARGTSPDFVVLDCQMPGMTGLQAIPHIRKAAPRARIVVLSGLGADRIGATARALGAADALEKGIDCAAIVPSLLALAGPPDPHAT